MATINRKYDSNNLNPRELQLFQFLWKWQVSSASLLVRHGCPDLPTGFIEGRLRKFNDVHVFRKESFDSQLRGFMITSRGNRCVQEMAGDYNEVNERSYLFEELLLIQALALGNSILFKEKPYEVFTMNEILKTPAEDLPEALRFQSQHIPGALIQRLGDNNQWKYWAIECALKKKTMIHFERIFEFYKTQKHITKIFWVVRDNEALAKLLKVAQNHLDFIDKINFILASDLIKKGWDAEVLTGPDAGRKICEIFGAEYVGVIQNSEVSTFGYSPQDYIKDTLLGSTRIFQQIQCPYKAKPQKAWGIHVRFKR